MSWLSFSTYICLDNLLYKIHPRSRNEGGKIIKDVPPMGNDKNYVVKVKRRHDAQVYNI
jgi:hypothetical protein